MKYLKVSRSMSGILKWLLLINNEELHLSEDIDYLVLKIF